MLPRFVVLLASLILVASLFQVESMEAEALRDLVDQSLARQFGEPGAVLEAMATNWSTDPNSGLAWSFLPVNGSVRDMDAYAEKLHLGGEVNIHWAGEAACRMLYGTVHAAIASGLRAAHEILGSPEGDGGWPLFDPSIRKACEHDAPGFTTKKQDRRRRGAG